MIESQQQQLANSIHGALMFQLSYYAPLLGEVI